MPSPIILATGSLDHKIRFWDATTGNCLTKSFNLGESQVNCIQISADKKLLVAGGNPLVHVYDINSTEDKPILAYEGHTNNVTTVGFQRDLKWIYSSSEDGTIKIWDPRCNYATKTYDCGAAVNTVALSPSQSLLISGDQNGFVKVWDLESDTCREEHLPIPDVPVRSISISADTSIVAVGSHKGKLFIYSSSNPKGGLQCVQEINAHDSYLLKVVISPDISLIATASADKTVKIWYPAPDSSGSGSSQTTNNWVLEKTLIHHQKWVWDAVFSADSVLLVTASSDQSSKLWDLRSGEVIRNYVGHNLAVTCVALNDSS